MSGDMRISQGLRNTWIKENNLISHFSINIFGVVWLDRVLDIFLAFGILSTFVNALLLWYLNDLWYYLYVTNFSLCLSVSVDFQVRALCVCLGVCLVFCLCCVLCFHDVIKAILVTSSSRMPSGVWRRSMSMVCWWWAAPGWCCLAAPSVCKH